MMVQLHRFERGTTPAASAAHADPFVFLTGSFGTPTGPKDAVLLNWILVDEHLRSAFPFRLFAEASRWVKDLSVWLRRMQTLHIESPVDYLDHLDRDPAEADHLLQELLIGVSQFFRNPLLKATTATATWRSWSYPILYRPTATREGTEACPVACEWALPETTMRVALRTQWESFPTSGAACPQEFSCSARPGILHGQSSVRRALNLDVPGPNTQLQAPRRRPGGRGLRLPVNHRQHPRRRRNRAPARTVVAGYRRTATAPVLSPSAPKLGPASKGRRRRR